MSLAVPLSPDVPVLSPTFQPVDPDWLPDARKRKYNWDRKSQVLVKKL